MVYFIIIFFQIFCRIEGKKVMVIPYFLAIDFDGTVSDIDVIDAVLEKFARPEWREVETLWEQDIIGSRECLERQMSMVEEPLERLLDFVDGFSLDSTFADFVRFLRKRAMPFAIVSDGFQVFIERLLSNAGINDIPVLANVLTEQNGKLTTVFPYVDPACNSANCKCMAVSEVSKGRDLILIGDGRSDFCMAGKARHVFTRKKLTGYCRVNRISHTPFDRFAQIKKCFDKKRVHRAPFIQLAQERINHGMS
jgi:2-hydroxy-3-keto-5-methylthiopentenyl-1-phosphate phosphatase